MNRNLHLAVLLLGSIAATQASAQSTSAAAASGPKTRAEVKADTAAAAKKGDMTRAAESSTLENAPPAVARTKQTKGMKHAPAASSN